MFSLIKSECLIEPIQMLLYQKQQLFSDFFLHFRNLYKIWITLKEEMALRVYFFLEDEHSLSVKANV